MGKVIATAALKSPQGFSYQLNLIHRDSNSHFGGFLSLETQLCDRTNTETRNTQTINLISAKDLDEMVKLFTKMRDAAAEREKQINDFNRVRHAIANPL